jgi:hypothetical protein
MKIRHYPDAERPRLQVIEGGRERRRVSRSSTALNQGVRASVVRIVLDSELEVPTLRKAANIAGVSEPLVLDVLRDYVYDLRARLLPRPPSGPAAMRRAA